MRRCRPTTVIGRALLAHPWKLDWAQQTYYFLKVGRSKPTTFPWLFTGLPTVPEHSSRCWRPL